MKGLELPPGFRFHPTDDELVNHYLCRKCAGYPIAVPIVAEIDLYKFDPWHLPELAVYGEKEWYFFSPRDRKYPNGSRPNRAAGSGYWKATGADKPIGKPNPLGIKKALVFYAGKAPKGIKTNWIMHEYRLANVDRSAPKKTTTNSNSRLDDWVLCRIYNKKGKIEKHNYNNNQVNKYPEEAEAEDEDDDTDIAHHDQKPDITSLISHPITTSTDQITWQMDGSDSGARDSSTTSEHVSLSPEVSSSEPPPPPPPAAQWNNIEFGIGGYYNIMDYSDQFHYMHDDGLQNDHYIFGAAGQQLDAFINF